MKRYLSFLMALCMLMSLAMPTVYATQPTTLSAEQPADLTVDFSTAFNNAGVAVSTYLQTAAAKLNAAYETNQWTVYCDDNGNSVRPNNLYAGGRNRAGHLELRNNNIASYGATSMLPSVFVAPGTGAYRLSISYGTASIADNKVIEMGAYILEKPEVSYTKYNVPTPTDSNILTKAYIENPYIDGAGSGTFSSDDTVALEAGKEYLIIFYGVAGDTTNAYADFKGFSLTFENTIPEATEPEVTVPETTIPEETTEPEKPNIPAMSVVFGDDFASAGIARNTYLQSTDAWQTINAGYPHTNKWKFYVDPTENSTSSGKPVNTSYPGRVYSDSMLYQMKTNVAITKEYTALQFTAPGTGYYSLSVTFANSPSSTDANQFSAYILPMADYTRYTIASACNAPLLVVESGFDGIYQGEATAALTEGTEYILVFCIYGEERGLTLELSGFSLYQEENEVIPEATEPEIPDGPGYTENVYDFYAGRQAGSTLNDGKDTLAAWFEAGSINWKFEAMSTGLNLEKTSYVSAIKSMRVISAANWWLAVRIKAPSQDGQYAIKMTHGAGGNGATAGSIYVIPGDTAENKITQVSYKTGAAMTTDWFYGENTSDTIGGRETTAGTVNLKAGEEYIVVFLPTEKSLINNNAYFWLGQLAVTRIGDYVEEEVEEDGSILYEFYDWDHPGDYLCHYKTEEELGKEILTDEIAAQYAAGERNWCYQTSNGYANFSTGMPYLNITAGETQYFCLKIKSPGTGTYEITYNHYATANIKAAASGGVYIVPAEEGMDYATIRNEADFINPILSTTYQAEKTTLKQAIGTYTAFQEGKEYFICFSVEDYDSTKNSSLYCYPLSLSMVRTGEYVAIQHAGQCGENAFWSLDEEGTLTISGTGPMYHYARNTRPWLKVRHKINNVIIEDGITTIGSYAFYGFTNLIQMQIPDSVTTIGASALRECSSLKNLVLSDNLIRVGGYAFYNCNSLNYNTYDNAIYLGSTVNPYFVLVKASSSDIKTCNIHKNTKIIYDSAFENCSNLTEITIPDGITSIVYRTFSGCVNLTDVTLPDSLISISSNAFHDCQSLESIEIPNRVTTIGYWAFSNCTSLTAVEIPDSVRSLGEGAFDSCKNLTDVKISNNVTSLVYSTFAHCTSLTDIVIPYSVTSIVYSTFYDCSNLKEIALPDSITTIGSEVFSLCSSLEKIAIPDSVTTIGWGAFAKCNALTDVYYSGTEEQWDSISIDTMNEPLTGAVIHYNAALVDENAPQIVVESKQITKNKAYTIAVEIKNNPGFSYLELTPLMPSQFTLINVENGELCSDFTSGKQYIWIADEDVTDDGLLLTLTFLVDNSAELGNYRINFRLRTCGNYNEDPVTLYIVPANITVIDTIYGDVNGDDLVDGFDLVRLKKYFANYDYDTGSSSVEIFQGADVNGDGKIDGLDTIRLKKYLANYNYLTGESTTILGPLVK